MAVADIDAFERALGVRFFATMRAISSATTSLCLSVEPGGSVKLTSDWLTLTAGWKVIGKVANNTPLRRSATDARADHVRCDGRGTAT